MFRLKSNAIDIFLRHSCRSYLIVAVAVFVFSLCITVVGRIPFLATREISAAIFSASSFIALISATTVVAIGVCASTVLFILKVALPPCLIYGIALACSTVLITVVFIPAPAS
jgi:hypothetical protein